MKIINRSDSEYFKRMNPYFDSGSSYRREADTIVLFVLKTSKGRLSKYWATLRFNSERNVKNKIDQVKIEYDRLISTVFKGEVKKGYYISEVILYSGEL